MGIDGSGKTTQALMLEDSLRKNGFDCFYTHLVGPPLLKYVSPKKYYFFRNHMIPKDLLDANEGQNFKKPGRLEIYVWLIASLIDSWTDNCVVFFRMKGKILLQDRVFFQKIINYFAAAPDWLLSLYIKLFPRPDIVFYFDIDPRLAVKRKKEDDLSFLIAQKDSCEKILRLIKNKIVILDSNKEKEETHQKVLDNTIDFLKRKNE